METIEQRRNEKLESLSKLLDSIYDEQTGELQQADPSDREKQERAIVLSMFGL